LISNVSAKDLKTIAKKENWIHRLFHPVSEMVKNEAVYGKKKNKHKHKHKQT